MGGAAGPRAARLAARYADEYNTVAPTLDEIPERKANIDAACAKAGREPIPFTVMTPSSAGKGPHPTPRGSGRARGPTRDIGSTAASIRSRRGWASCEAAGVSGAYLQMQATATSRWSS